MAGDPVARFSETLRRWVKSTTGKSIGAVDTTRFPSSSIYRQTDGKHVVSGADLRAIVTVCVPNDLVGEADRREWIAAELGPLETLRKGALAYAEVKGRSGQESADDASSGHGASVAPAEPTPASGSSSGLTRHLELLREQVAEAAEVLPTTRQPLLLEREIASALAELTEFVEHTTRGQIVRSGTDLRDLIMQTRACTSTIQATTTLSTTAIQSKRSWWDSPGATAYTEENKQAVSRGVEIHRIFIVDVFDKAIEGFIRKQVEMGVKASWVLASSLATPHRTNVLVWDGRIGWKALIATTGEISENWLYTSEGDIRRLLAVFEGCRDSANAM